MKCEVIIDTGCEEKVIIHARSRTRLVDDIEALITSSEARITGYANGEIRIVDPEDTACFISEDGKVYAICKNERLRIRERLYNIEEILGGVFIKINQSCIANPKMIEKFQVSIGGAIRVVFKNGYTDYISRRQLKHVKERMGVDI